MEEKVKRLSPTTKTLRELYLKSGNQCAFPNCSQHIVDEKGKFIGNVCHIEAALEGGERFNKNMTNEERRAYKNLILLCPTHHTTTNDVLAYSVDTLKNMKSVHEKKFLGIMREMKNSIEDYNINNSYIQSNTCYFMNKILEWRVSKEECKESAKVFNTILPVLKSLPVETRKILAIMVKYSRYTPGGCKIPLHEVELAIDKSSTYINRHHEILQNKGLLSEVECESPGCNFCNLKSVKQMPWEFWEDIRYFCEKTNINICDLFVNLDFSLFD